MNKQPDRLPLLPGIILRIFLQSSSVEGYIGDLTEEYTDTVRKQGFFRAYFWLWSVALRSVPGGAWRNLKWTFAMYGNYLKVTLRKIRRNKTYSFINIAGLAGGMASCLLILLWVFDEVSVNRFHENLDDLSWLVLRNRTEAESYLIYCTPPALGPALADEYPEIVQSVRIMNGTQTHLVTCGRKKFNEKIKMADLSVFQAFSFPLLQGTVDYGTGDPMVIYLNEAVAQKYFGNEDPIGKTVLIDNRFAVTVAGVFQNIRSNSTITFTMVMPPEFLDICRNPGYTASWDNYSFQTYFLLQPGSSREALNGKISDRIRKVYPDSQNEPVALPLKDLYLKYYEKKTGVKVFSSIALIILVIASINFINLTTARSALRAGEVGVRKAAGARRTELIGQFLGESFILAAIALCAALIITGAALPAFNELTGKSMSMYNLLRPGIITAVFTVLLATAFLSGSYPAFLLSSIKPAAAVKITFAASSSGSVLRKILVIGQFTLAVALILITTVIFRQADFLEHKQLGFDRSSVICLPVNGELVNRYEAFKKELLENSHVQYAAVSSVPILRVSAMWTGWYWEGKETVDDPAIRYMSTDVGFEKVFGMDIIKGKAFSENTSGAVTEVIVNESFTKYMGIDNPVGTILLNEDKDRFGGQFRIVGVVKDFHFRPVYEKISPLIILNGYDKSLARYFYAKLSPGGMAQTIQSIRQEWERFNPVYPFEYHFLDEDFGSMFTDLGRLTALMRSFTALAIFISCLGMFGLASFIVLQRKKEIGIRKVLGASVHGIAGLLTKEFIVCVLTANIIAAPAAFYIMRRWLDNYAYKTEVSAVLFISTGILTVLIALITVLFQSIRASYTDSVTALKSE